MYLYLQLFILQFAASIIIYVVGIYVVVYV
jgi:hypothetical protein